MMKFHMSEWTRIYYMVKKLGKMLKDSRPDMNGNRAASELTPETRKALEEEINYLNIRCNNYMDRCGLYSAKPLWIYDHKDPTTWASDPSFKYGHLLKYTDINRVD